MKKQIKQSIEFHKKIDAMEKAIFKFDVDPTKNVELDERLKTIYVNLQEIKTLIYDDKILYRGNK